MDTATKNLDTITAGACESFWATITEALPEIRTGDLPPDAVAKFERVARETVGQWYAVNRPVADSEDSQFTARKACVVLTAGAGSRLGVGSEFISSEYIGSGDACRIDLAGDAWIWVTEDMGGDDGWQCCLYFEPDHEGFYLDGPFPTTPEGLLETVAALITARGVWETLNGLRDGTGVSLVLKGGGVETGTLTRVDYRGYGIGLRVRQSNPEVLYALDDIRAVGVIG